MPYQGNYINSNDVLNWPSGTTDAKEQAVIETAEAILDAALGAPQYPKAFDLRINGNGKNRLFIPLNNRILTVTAIEVGGVDLTADVWAFDGGSVFIDLSSSGQAGWASPEAMYLLTEADAVGIFPRGFNNIRIVGTCGNAVPAWAKKAATMLAEAQNDGSLYPTYTPGSETIGRYSYSLSAPAGPKDRRYFITGIKAVDDLIRPFCGKKKVTIMAP